MSALNANETPSPGFEPKIVEAPPPVGITLSVPVKPEEPITPRDRIKAILISIGMLVAGISMWIWHKFYVSHFIARLFSDEPVQGFRLKLDIIWCRPTGAVLVLLGSLVLLGALTRKSPSAPKP